MPKRPKSLDAPVVMQLHRLEAWAYLRCDQWKKKYRYTLVNDFRQHITNAKNNAIRAFEMSNRKISVSALGKYLKPSEDYRKISVNPRYSTKERYKANYRVFRKQFKTIEL